MGKPENPPLLPKLGVLTLCFVLVGGVFSFVEYFIDIEPPVSKTDSPHIVFVLADDLGWDDVSFHGSPQIPTPNLDALAASGIILNNYYVQPQCTPSRGALMSGRYPNKLGLQHYVLLPSQRSALPLDVVTLPQHLKRLGYVNHLIGKWHLGYFTREYLPTRRGFDSYFGYLNGYLDYYDYTHYSDNLDPILRMRMREESIRRAAEKMGKDVSFQNNSSTTDTIRPEEIPEVLFGVDLMENEEIIKNFRCRYATEVFTEKAVDVIADHNTSVPLFLMVSHLAVHVGNPMAPLQAPLEVISRNTHINHPERKLYAGMVSSLDDSVGAIFQALNEKGILNNTIFIFSSDNGGVISSHPSGAGSNWPLRGAKFHLWEGGVRVPGLIWSPLLQLQQPRTSMQMMHITDWLPTLYAAAGGDAEDLGDIDGVNMWHHLVENSPSPRDEILLTIDPEYNMSGLRLGHLKYLSGSFPYDENDWYQTPGKVDMDITSMDDWVWRNGSLIRDILLENDFWLIEEPDSWRRDAQVICGENFMPKTGKCNLIRGPCLFNVTKDPCEYYNLASIFPEVVTVMQRRLSELDESSIPPVSTKFDPRANPLRHDFTYVPWLDEENDAI